VLVLKPGILETGNQTVLQMMGIKGNLFAFLSFFHLIPQWIIFKLALSIWLLSFSVLGTT